MITAFDLGTLEKLDDMVSRHKIASADILNVSVERLGKNSKAVYCLLERLHLMI